MKKLVGPATAVLENPDTGNSDLGFAQPVAVERLVPFDLQQLEEPLAGRQPTLEIRTGAGDAWRAATIVAQLATGAVRLRFADEEEAIVDLANEEYRWTSGNAGADPGGY